MKQRYHEILDDKNNFLNQAVRELLCKRYDISWKRQKPKAHPENYRGGQSVQNINALLWCFTENLHHTEISLNLKPARNPQLFQRTVLQI